MKATTEKNTSSSQGAPARQPFFSKDGEGGFFSEGENEKNSFFDIKGTLNNNNPAIQAKLAIGKTGDIYEQEADRVSEQTLNGRNNPDKAPSVPIISRINSGSHKTIISPSAQNPKEEKEAQDELQMQDPPDGQFLQRKEMASLGAEEEENIQAKRRNGDDDREEQNAFSSVQAALNQSSSGLPLSPEIRPDLEHQTALDLNDVRVHQTPISDAATASIGARAFTNRNNIHLSSGESSNNLGLIAHEVTHVIQQGGIARKSPQITAAENESNPVQQTPSGVNVLPQELSKSGLTNKLDSINAGKGTGIKQSPDIYEERPGDNTSRNKSSNSNINQQGGLTLTEKNSANVTPKIPKHSTDETKTEDNGKTSEKQVASTSQKSLNKKTNPIPEGQTHLATQASSSEVTGIAKDAQQSIQGEKMSENETGGSVTTKQGSASSTGGNSNNFSSGEDSSFEEETANTDADAEAQKTEKRMAGASGDAANETGETDNTEQTAAPDNQQAEETETSSENKPAEQSSKDDELTSPGTESLQEQINSEASDGEALKMPPPQVPATTLPVSPVPEPERDEAEMPQTSNEGSELPGAERDAAMSAVAETSDTGEGVPTGGSGDGSPIEEQPQQELPDVSALEPPDAMAAVGNLPPAQMQQALGGVSAATTRSADEQRQQLAAHPPELPSPSGAPAIRQTPRIQPIAPSVAEGVPALEAVPQGQVFAVPPPASLPAPAPPPTERISTPQVGNAADQISSDDATVLQSSMRHLPVSDPALAVDAGSPPVLDLSGNADPAHTQAQRTQLDQSMAAARAQGQRDAAQRMGEDEIYPSVSQDGLQAQIQVNRSGSAGVRNVGMPPNADAVSAIANEQQGTEIQAAATQAQNDMAAQRQQHQERVLQEQGSSREEITRLEAENSAQQAGERTQALAEVQSVRGEWNQAQQDAVAGRSEEANRAQEEGIEEVATERQRGEVEAATHIEQGNNEAATERQRGEQEAASERERGEQESSGVFGWLASRARAFFDGVKRGIQRAFERARAAVRMVIDRARQLATAVIERARQAIVSVIRRVGDALIAIGDRLLADFPALRDRFRTAIRERVERAEASVNRLANNLRQGVQRALDLLGRGLDAALGLMERGMLAAVTGLNNVVQGALKAAQAIANAIGAFVALIRDIAPNPGQWLRNLGSSIMDGIRNHLWTAFKTEVKTWFNTKLEMVLGLGSAIWGVLKKGGINLAQIGTMVWQGIKSAIPPALIALLIERLIAMLIPAAAAVMAIVQGLQAAWGAASQIIRAFGLFFTFLRAVKGGNAGRQFAAALAAGAVAVIEFVSSWLLRKLMKAAAKIGARIKAIAQRIMQRLRRVLSRAGRALRRAGRRIGRRFRRFTDRFRGKGRKGKRDKRHTPAFQEKARRETIASINRSLQSGIPKILLKAKIFALKLRYRWGTLKIQSHPDQKFEVIGGFSPAAPIVNGIEVLKLIDTGISVPRLRDQKGRTGEGTLYQASLHRNYLPQLASTLFPNHAVEFTAGFGPTQGAQKHGSTIDTVRIATERGHAARQGGVASRPDWSTTVLDPNVRTRELQEVHLFEATLASSFESKKFGEHKVEQVDNTLEKILIKYQKDFPDSFPKSTILYHVISPQPFSDATRNYIISVASNLSSKFGVKIQFQWRIVGR